MLYNDILGGINILPNIDAIIATDTKNQKEFGYS